MVHILGVLLRDSWPAKWAFRKFYGIGAHTAERICARFQIHDKAQMRDLTPQQVAQISAFLSAPSTTANLPILPLAPARFKPPSTAPVPQLQSVRKDPLKELKIESELRREIKENIAHHRMIGSYVGRRHAMGMPVRGQRTSSNASTARKLNRIERRN
ncbi:hypothetical protein M422DRAFT_60469 [Sphaerobolus stellatus SS14]|uniref:Small ribosomal subunit protein uS13m n=1 Tax=Sphaerobolus stellatus (strain SS14) TaxID=990650 RepID=A0A0C9VIG2_SPHS4|nr:hypothetical protein M422DRAFT_60469 [Sphaerobolus stellatus SS14]